VDDTGHEHPSLALSKTWISAMGGTESDARNAVDSAQDPDLAEIVTAWPKMPDYVKAAIKVFIQRYSGWHSLK